MAYIFGGSTGETADSLKQRRAYARALLESAIGQRPQTIGDGIAVLGSAFAGRFHNWRADQVEKQLTDQALGDFNRDFKRNKIADMLVGGGEISGSGGADTLAGGGGRDRFAKPFKVSDPVAEDLAPHQKALLNSISGGESGGAYNVRYTPRGPAYFDNLSQHPGIFEQGPHGKTSASGRYQFTKTTWDGMGGGDFSPANQDRRAWQLAQRDYGARTGRSLDADLQAGGLTPQIMQALTPTWQAFKGNRARHMATYRDSLGRFSSSAGADSLPGGEGNDLLMDGNPRALPFVQKGAPAYPRPDARVGYQGHGINTMTGGPSSITQVPPGQATLNPLPPDRPMPSGPIPQASAYGRNMTPYSPLPPDRPMPMGPMSQPPQRQYVPTPQQGPVPQSRYMPGQGVDRVQTASVPQRRFPGIVSPRAEDNGYTRGPGAAPQNMMAGQPGGQGGGLLGRLLARQPMPGPQQASDPMPTAGTVQGEASGDDLTRLYALASNEMLPEGHRAAVLAEIKRREQSLDPEYQLGMEEKRLTLEKTRRDLAKAGDPDFKVVGNDLVRIGPDGSTSIVTPQGGGQPNTGPFRFSGSSVEAQALNGLMNSGALTPEQAQQLGAGKTVTGPNGETLFMTPQGVFGKPAGGGAPQPVSSTTASSQPVPGGTQSASGGMIPVTGPKVTVDERQAMTFADRLAASGKIIGDKESAGLGVKDNFVRNNAYIPDVMENWLVSDDYQALDQASRDFINAQLRRESGAVISPEEFDNAYKQYLPRPGDTPQVLRQKAANRKTVIDGMARSAGPTYAGGDKGGDDFSRMTDEELEAIANGR